MAGSTYEKKIAVSSTGWARKRVAHMFTITPGLIRDRKVISYNKLSPSATDANWLANMR